MNAIKRWLRPVPTEPAPKPTHAADRDSQPALVLVRPERVAPVLPPVRPVRASARADDPAPIFDEAMDAMPIDTQFEVAFILDVERLDMDDDEHADVISEAVKAVDHGWGESA